MLKCGHIALPWGYVRQLVQGKIIKDAWCEDCETWQPMMGKPTLCELLGLPNPPELPIDPPF